MNYKINPLAFTGIFAVPTAVVDDNLRLASALQLKTLLYMLRHATDTDITLADISRATGYDEADIDDALIFWAERGLLVKGDSAPVVPVTAPKQAEASPATAAPAAPSPAQTVKRVEEIPVTKPSHEQVAARLQESEQLRLLFAEAQNILGKTVGYDGQSTLIMMHDSYGLPVEVILMAIEYNKNKGKTGFAAISKTGREWSELEIDSIEGAIEYIESHNVVDEAWQKLRSMTEITNKNPTQKQRRMLTAWTKEYGFSTDMIYFAYEEAIDNTGKISFEYMDKVLSSWHRNAVKTPQDIQREKIKWQQQKAKAAPAKSIKQKPPGERREPTFDVSAFTKKATNIKYVPPSEED
ncbi:MAG: DnaD domain protein [Ruminococcaceae bacterium]|nr:DnaD domain protein [Oscillospiraceae bacterium]